MKMTLEEKKNRKKRLKKRHWISERQLQGLVSYEIKHTRECLANVVRKQDIDNKKIIEFIRKRNKQEGVLMTTLNNEEVHILYDHDLIEIEKGEAENV